MKRHRIVTWLMLIGGALLLLGGVWGAYSLHMASQQYTHTTGVVRSLQTKKVYRHRKLRYESKMRISYPAGKYGELSAFTTNYNPFRSEGDRLPVWYHPERPRDIRLPQEDSALSVLLLVSGLICICGAYSVRHLSGTTHQTNQ